MRLVSAFVAAIGALWCLTGPALADRRVALIFGNSAYQNVPLLANPTNDSAAMATMLKGAGFDVVTLKRDLKANEMRRALRDFSDDARDADVAIIYYAGHGLEIEGANYLIPVDAVLERDIDAYDEAISLDRVLAAVEPARKLRLVILDACRDNPFAKTMKHTMASRSIGRGLSRIEPTNPNTLIAFAAKAGSTAADGDDKNSPFTSALVKYLPRPGLDLRKAFGFVRDDVLKVTHNRQEPFVYGSLGGDDVALVPAPAIAPPPVQAAPVVDPYAAARVDYELALQLNVASAWDSFISRYPVGFYTDLAVAQRNKIRAAQAAAGEETRLALEQKALAEARAAQAEQTRVAAQAKAAQDARIAADNARLAEQAKAAQDREAFEKQKAAELAKATEMKKIAEAKAAEAKAADAKAAEAKAAEVARAKAAADEVTRVAALAPPPSLNAGHEIKSADAPSVSGCGVATRAATLAPRAATALSASEECGLKPRDSFRECENCPEMVMVPAGQVLMGSDKSDIDGGVAAPNEGPQHLAVIRQPIAVGRFEVTRDQYAAFVRQAGYSSGDRCFTFENGQPQERTGRSFLNPGYKQDGNHPAVCISWINAKAYVDWLSRSTGKSYRLLSEAEFEYVARAGGSARYGVSNDPADLCKLANGADQSARAAGLPADAPYMNCKDGYPFTAPAGSFAANAFGIYDLIGNVWEWSEDCFYGDYATAKLETASRSAEVCTARTVRGGDWFSTEVSLRPAVRAKANADAHHDDIGFRVVRTLTQ